MNEQKNESTLAKKGGISVETAHIFPVIKKWLYSEKEIFLREIVSNACDAVTKLKRLSSLGEVNNVFRQACSGNTGSYMSVATGRRKMLQQLLDNLVKDIG